MKAVAARFPLKERCHICNTFTFRKVGRLSTGSLGTTSTAVRLLWVTIHVPLGWKTYCTRKHYSITQPNKIMSHLQESQQSEGLCNGRLFSCMGHSVSSDLPNIVLGSPTNAITFLREPFARLQSGRILLSQEYRTLMSFTAGLCNRFSLFNCPSRLCTPRTGTEHLFPLAAHGRNTAHR